MAQLVVRNLDDGVKERLRRRAARNGRSMEEEVRAVLAAAASPEDPPPLPLGSRIAARFRGLGLQDGDIREFHGEAVRPASFEA